MMNRKGKGAREVSAGAEQCGAWRRVGGALRDIRGGWWTDNEEDKGSEAVADVVGKALRRYVMFGDRVVPPLTQSDLTVWVREPGYSGIRRSERQSAVWVRGETQGRR